MGRRRRHPSVYGFVGGGFSPDTSTVSVVVVVVLSGVRSVFCSTVFVVSPSVVVVVVTVFVLVVAVGPQPNVPMPKVRAAASESRVFIRFSCNW